MCFVYSNSNNNSINNINYITDEYGKIYMTVNVMGHVKNPGRHIIGQDANILDLIATAGGLLPGASKKEIVIYSKNNGKQIINLKFSLKSNTYSEIQFSPNDTIYINRNLSSYIIESSPFINLMLSVLNMYIIITNVS